MAVAGRVLMIPAGTWTSGTNYGMLDVVIYAGSSYVAKKQINNSTVAPPSAPSDWQLLAQGYDVTNVVTKSMIVNNFLATDPNTVLSGPMGKSLKDQLDTANSNLTDLASKVTNKGVYSGDLNNIPVAINTLTVYRAAANCTNAPTSVYGIVETMYVDGSSYAIQRFTAMNTTSNMWIRTKGTSGWNSWVEK